MYKLVTEKLKFRHMLEGSGVLVVITKLKSAAHAGTAACQNLGILRYGHLWQESWRGSPRRSVQTSSQEVHSKFQYVAPRRASRQMDRVLAQRLFDFATGLARRMWENRQIRSTGNRADQA